MVYTVKNEHVHKSEILPKWMAKVFYSRCALFEYDLHVYKLWNTARWQEPAFDKASDLRSTFDRRVKRSSIEPKEILCTGLKSHFVTKYLVGGLVLVHGLSLMECRILNTNRPRESDHSLNVMTGLYCILDKILAIYVARQMIQNVLWAEV